MSEEAFGEFFEKICDIDMITVNQTTCCLTHYPLLNWEGRGIGVINLFGHMHNDDEESHQIAFSRHGYNVGVAVNHYTPVSLDEVIENNTYLIKNRTFKANFKL